MIRTPEQLMREGGTVETIGEICRKCGDPYIVYAIGMLQDTECPSCGNPSEFYAAALACKRAG